MNARTWRREMAGCRISGRLRALWPLAGLAGLLLLGSSGCSGSEAPSSPSGVDDGGYSAQLEDMKQKLEHVYFGELHAHTALSLDAYAGQRVFWLSHRDWQEAAAACHVASPCRAYEYARSVAGLDFVALNDHAEEPTPISKAVLDASAENIKEHMAQNWPEEFKERFLEIEDCIVEMPGNIVSALNAQCTGAGDDFHFYDSSQGGSPAGVTGVVDVDVAGETNWSLTQRLVQSFDKACQNEPATCLIVFPGFEHTGARYGHKNVVFRDAAAVPERMFSSVQPGPGGELQDVEPQNLWNWLECHRSGPASACDSRMGDDDRYDYLTIVHTPGEEPNHDTDWGKLPQNVTVETVEYALKGKAMPLGEIFSRHGNSECADDDWTACYETIPGHDPEDSPYHNPEKTLSAQMPNWIDSGDENLRLGFVGGTDTHSGRPGDLDNNRVPYMYRPPYDSYDVEYAFDQMNRGSGITGVYVDPADHDGPSTRSREGIWRALKDRSTFATSGPKIRLLFGIESLAPYYQAATMGKLMQVQPGAQGRSIRVKLNLAVSLDDATQAIQKVDFVKNGSYAAPVCSVVPTMDPTTKVATASCTQTIGASEARAYFYARVYAKKTRARPEVKEEDWNLAWSSPVWIER